MICLNGASTPGATTVSMPHCWARFSPPKFVERLPGPQQGDAPPWPDALGDRRAGGMQRVLDAAISSPFISSSVEAPTRISARRRRAWRCARRASRGRSRWSTSRTSAFSAAMRAWICAARRWPAIRVVLVLSLSMGGHGRVRPASPSPATVPSPRRSPARPVTMAMVLQQRARRSPKPGALAALTFSHARTALTTNVASASPVTSRRSPAAACWP